MPEHHVLNLGAGVQSTTLYLLAMAGEIKIDCAIFADTQDEPPAVYRHLDWLRSLNGPTIHTGTVGSLKQNILKGMNSTGQRFVSIPCFTKHPDEGKKEGMLRRQCTKEFKIDVVYQIIRRVLLGLKPRQRVPKGTTVVQYYGISVDEVRRMGRIQARLAKTKWARGVFPLIDKGWSRRGCQEYLKGRVPHPVARSACVYCPLQNDYEWREKKVSRPEEFAAAVEVDDALRVPGTVANRGMDNPMFLHRSCIPLKLIDFDNLPPQQLDGFTLFNCTGMCGN